MYLNCHSYYSLRYGTLTVERLSELAAAVGVERLVMTDINNTTGVPDFVRECRSRDIAPAAGIEFRDGNTLLYIGIARNNEGFRELNEFLTHHNFTGEPLPNRPPSFPNAYVIYPSGGGVNGSAAPRDNGYNGGVSGGAATPGNGTGSSGGVAGSGITPAMLRDNEYLGIRPSAAGRLLSTAKNELSKYVILQPVTMESPTDYPVHRSLRAVDNNLLLSRLEPHMSASPDEIITPESELIRPFSMWPQLVENTRRLLNDCSLEIDFTTHKNKKVYSASRYDDKLLLEKLAWDGMKYRYGANNKVAEERVRHELEIIDRLGFSAYFLITWDIIRYSMSCGFYHVGRGSGANSVVAYCLKITNVDPIDLNLYFERFINPKRTSPPDFDIDYSWKERDTVTEYIFRRYGHRHTALLGTVNTFRGKSIVRELGKVYGLPVDLLDGKPVHLAQRVTAVRYRILSSGPGIRLPTSRTCAAYTPGGCLFPKIPSAATPPSTCRQRGFPPPSGTCTPPRSWVTRSLTY